MAFVSGTVKDDTGSPVAGRIVRVYRRDTGELLGDDITGDGTGGVDPEFANVSCLLHFDGPSDSTVFTDSGPRPKTFSAVSGAKLTGAVSLFGGACLSLTTSGAHISAPSHTDFDVSTSDFTIEMAVRPLGFSASQILINKANGTNPGYPFQIYITSSAGVVARAYNSGSGMLYQIASANSVVAANQFNWIKLRRIGSTYQLYVGSTMVGETTYVGDLPSNSDTLTIGAYSNGTYGLNGYIDEFRFTKSARTETSPPTAPYPNTGTPKGLGQFVIDTGSHIGEVHAICLDDAGGTTYNDLILRVTPV